MKKAHVGEYQVEDLKITFPFEAHPHLVNYVHVLHGGYLIFQCKIEFYFTE